MVRKPAVWVILAVLAFGATAAFIGRQSGEAPSAVTADGLPTAEHALEQQAPAMPTPNPTVLDVARSAPSPSPSSALSATPADAENAAASEIRSLVTDGRIGAARSRANAYYERFPNGPARAEIERLTGAHPTSDRAR